MASIRTAVRAFAEIAAACAGFWAAGCGGAADPGAEERQDGGAVEIDVDGDGFGAGLDCDDSDPLAHPGAPDEVALGPWTSTPIAWEVTGGAVGVAVEPGGALHAAFRVPEGIRYASRARGEAEWTAATIAGTEDDWLQGFALDGRGTAHLAFGQFESVHYAAGGRIGFDVEEIALGDLYLVQFAVDPAGTPHLLLEDPEVSLIVSTRSEGTWSQERVDMEGATGHALALAYDDESEPHIVLADSRGPISHVHRGVGGWAAESVAEVPPHLAHFYDPVAIDASRGSLRIAHGWMEYDFEHNWAGQTAVGVWAGEGGAWQESVTLDPALAYRCLSVRTGEDDSIHLLWGGYRDLFYATDARGGGWILERLSADFSESTACALAVGAGNVAHVLYGRVTADPLVQAELVYITNGVAEDWIDEDCDGFDG